MSTDDTPQITMVEVTRHDVVLQMEDILEPLVQTAAILSAAPQAAPEGVAREVASVRSLAAANPELVQHLQSFNDLVTQLRDVVNKINQIDPSLLASKPGPPPSVGGN